MSASIIAVVDASPIFRPTKHVLDLVPLAVENFFISRGGSACLNSLLGLDKWKTAFLMLPAELPSAC